MSDRVKVTRAKRRGQAEAIIEGDLLRVTRAKTREQVKLEFAQRGQSVAAWAAQYELHPSMVRDVLAGTRPALRGESHRAAVLLGIKVGEASLRREH